MTQLKERLLSLDVFRGLAVASMLLVDYPGSWEYKYAPLLHAQWNGITPADLIFPFFLFIVGVSITFSLSTKKEQGTPTKTIMIRVLRRCLLLFALGIILDIFYNENFLDFSTIRILGVLQRIAIVYFISTFLFLKTGTRTLLSIGGGILVFYWLLMTRVPVPGVGMPDLSVVPNGNVTNLAGWLDSVVLGPHAWIWTKPWDPEGILSTLPAIVTTIMGIVTGTWLKSKADKTTKTVWMFVAGNFSLLAGYLWDVWFPINKSIWTSSFVLFSGGWTLIFFAMFYWIIDVQGYKKWAKPLQIYGMNAITAFFLCGLMDGILAKIPVTDNGSAINAKAYIFNHYFASWLEPYIASLFYAICVVLLWLGVLWMMYRKKIFLKV